MSNACTISDCRITAVAHLGGDMFACQPHTEMLTRHAARAICDLRSPESLAYHNTHCVQQTEHSGLNNMLTAMYESAIQAELKRSTTPQQLVDRAFMDLTDAIVTYQRVLDVYKQRTGRNGVGFSQFDDYAREVSEARALYDAAIRCLVEWERRNLP